MDSQFITNEKVVLSEIINSILPNCDNAYFLVGYFYFSGFSELYHKLKDTKLRILVGLDIERGVINQIREIDNLSNSKKSRGQIRSETYDAFVDVFNNTDFFDTKQQVEAFKVFYDKIKDGTLEIRKTKDPNHAKMYLFENRDEHTACGTFPGTLITGSSNLSISGLKNRMELNAIFRGKGDFNSGKSIFDELWQNAIVIADQQHIEDFDDSVIKHIWYEKLYEPHLLYLRVLNEYFTIPQRDNVLTPHDITNGKFLNLKYQTDAVNMAINAIENHNGVIVSDVVGLGKSIIASTVAHNLKYKTFIIAPPHLVSQWEEYLIDFGFSALVFSSGKIGEALDKYQQLTRLNETALIVIDEAHKYRNEVTKDYADLHNLCSGNKVMLLTATPFNNHPADIFSLLKLFQIPSKSTLKTVENLGNEFKELIAEYEKLKKEQRNKKDVDLETNLNKIANRIRAIIYPLMVRRSRLDLENIVDYKDDLTQQGVKFPIVKDPIELKYSLGGLKDLYLKTLNIISFVEDEDGEEIEKPERAFKATRYNISKFIVTEGEKRKELEKIIENEFGQNLNLFIGSQRNISKFMRRLLVRRFESSKAAFLKSLNYMIDSSEHILKWIEKRDKMPIFKKGYLPDVDYFYNANDENVTEEIQANLDSFTDRGLFEIDMKYIKDGFIDEVKADIELLKDIRKEWFNDKLEIGFDPKLESFRKVLKDKEKSDPKRKIVVFTEFADTANYLGEALKDEGLRIFKYTGSDSSRANKQTIRDNFDAGRERDKQKNDYQILIATDAISEGYNLHRAGAIFNYDIPYNPTRVIQRVGRINRINKKVFSELYIYNFFPTDVGEKETRTKEISTLKMAMIHAIMGEDTKYLVKEEQLNAYFKERYEMELKSSESESWETPYINYLNSFKGTESITKALAVPHRVKIGRKVEKPIQGVILFGKKGNDYVFKLGSAFNDCVTLSPAEAFELFSAEIEEKPRKVSEHFESIYQELKQQLFISLSPNKNEKIRLQASDKVKLIAQKGDITMDYAADLQKAIELDALAGMEIRFINRLKPKDYHTLPKEITQRYLDRLVSRANSVDDGIEALILSEEIQ